MEYISKLTKTGPKGQSLLTIMPKSITELLDVTAGDCIIWDVDISKPGVQITISKKEE